MNITSYVKTSMRVSLTLLLLMAGLLSIFISHELKSAIFPDTLHGIETQFQFPAQHHANEEISEKPVLITGLFSTCAMTCPANISLLRQVNSGYPGDLNYLFIALKPDEDSAEKLTDFLADFAPDMQLILPADKNALRQVMSQLPEHFSDNWNTVHHSGYIYLMHPRAKGLITYRSPSFQHIINDLSTLQLRGK